MLTNSFSINLGLPDVEISDVETDQQEHYNIELRSTETEGCCHVCGETTPHFHGYDRKVTVQHLPILGKECHLHLQLPRFRCDACPSKSTRLCSLSGGDETVLIPPILKSTC